MANKTPFISGDTAQEAFIETRNWLWPYFLPIDEFERIARNRPSDKIDPHLPRVTDGTLAAVIQETPKRTIQQLPTGRVKCHDQPAYAAIADIVLVERIVPLYNRMGNSLQKDWNMLGKAMTWGRSASYTFFTQTNGQLHTDFVIPYVKDVLSEKGKVFAPDSNIVFMRSWYQKRDIKAIIQQEKNLQAKDKSYKTDWDLKALADLIDAAATPKPANLMTPAEKERGDGYSGGIEVIHAFQRGIGAESYSFSPRQENAKPLRTKVSKDPRGQLPIDFLYCNIDLSNPMGRSVPEISGGVQNLIDQQMQMFQFMTTMMMAPPLKVWGNPNKPTMKMRPNALWDMGPVNTSQVEEFAVNTHAVQNFPSLYGTLKSQILQLNQAEASATVSAESGNPSFSKTQAGVQAQQNQLSMTDNYLRKQFEAWDERQKETSLNIFFAEMNGKDVIELGPLQLQNLNTAFSEIGPDVAPKYLKDGKLLVNYKDISGVTFKFTVDPSSSKSVDDNDQVQKLNEILQQIGQNGLVMNWYLGQTGKKLNTGEIYAQLFKRMGLENIDNILVDMNEQEKMAAAQAPFPIIDKPQIRLTGQVPSGAMAAALQAGGVTINPQQAEKSPLEQLDLGDIYKDPNTPNTVRAQIQALAGLQPDMSTLGQPSIQQGGQSSGQSPATNPDDLALRQQDMDIKQQNVDLKKTQMALDIAKTAHQHTMEMHGAVQAANQPQEPNQPGDFSAPFNPNSPEERAEGDQTGGDDPMNPDEQQFAEALMHAGFDEATVEQAIVLKRQGMPVEQIMQVIGAKANAG